MRRIAVLAASLVAVLLAAPSGASVRSTNPSHVKVPPNVDVSRRHGNESEEAIAVNPTNPENIVIVTNIAEGFSGMFEGVSFDGGQTWKKSIIGAEQDASVGLGDSCCDASLSFDKYGNLFMTYLYDIEDEVPVALSTDGGLHFHVIAEISKVNLPAKKSRGDHRGLFRYVDQPTITAAENEVWVVFNAGGPMVATGARVTGFGKVGHFIPVEVAPQSNNCTYGDVAIGPSGQVMQACNLTSTGQGGGKEFVNVDRDGLGPAGFGHRIFVTQTHVGGFDFIPPQPDRSVDAEVGLAWDRTNAPHAGRVYMVYTREHPNESDNMDIYVRHSDDNGATWSGQTRVNDDHTVNSQFLPKISLDQTTGEIAVVWYDARNDLGKGGPGDTDGIPNDDAQFWGAFSSDGVHFTPNVRISQGTSNSHDSGNHIDYGDYDGLSFFGGVAHPAWADNSNRTGNNPDGTLSDLDIYTAAVNAPTR